MTLNLSKYIIVTLVILLVSIGGYSYFRINSLENTIQECRTSNTQYESAILYQNAELEEQKYNKKKAIKELDKWKALPPKVKWKTITNTIYKDVNNSKGGECEKNNIIEANVYKLDWNNF